MTTELNVQSIVKRQVVIVVDCGDSRAAGIVENNITTQLINAYNKRGVDVRFYRVIVPGSVINEFSYREIADIIGTEFRRALKEIGPEKLDFRGTGEPGLIPFEPIVYIRGHAGLRLPIADEQHPLVYKPSDLILDPQYATVNCGMAHASDFWEGILMPLLLDKLGSVPFYDKTIGEWVNLNINSRQTLLRLLRSLYFFDGADPENFVRDVDLRRGPLTSAAYLRQRLNRDTDIGNIAVHIIPSVRNYATGNDYRIGGNVDIVSVPDDKAVILPHVMAGLPEKDPERVLRMSKQEPRYGLMCPAGIHNNPRELLIRHLISLNGGEEINVSGNVCGISGVSITNPSSPFAPYKLIGTAYFVLALKVKEWFTLAKDHEESRLIRRKLEMAPIMSLILREGNVSIKHLVLADIKEDVRNAPESQLDAQKEELIRAGFEKCLRLRSREKSPLRLPVLQKLRG